jgi:septal ring factor EnvC (AmiA/AmiB activator)
LYSVVTSEGRWRVRVAAGLLLAAALLAAPTSLEPGPPGDPAADPRPTEAFAGSDVARLQRTATDVQRELADLASQIHDAERDLRTANDAAAAAHADRTAADQVVAAQQFEVDAYSARSTNRPRQPGPRTRPPQPPAAERRTWTDATRTRATGRPRCPPNSRA